MIYENKMKDIQYPIKCAVMKGNLPFMNHCHQEVEIIQLRTGNLKVVYEGEKMNLQEGDIWIIPPFGSHSIDHGSSDCERLAILVDIKDMGVWMKGNEEWMRMQNAFDKADMFSGHWTSDTKLHVTSIVERLYDEYCNKGYAWQLAINTLMNELLLTVLREMPHSEKHKDNHHVFKLKNILEYVALNYCGELSLKVCAEYAGFNPTYLSRYFSGHMGITFQEYVKKLRIDRAKWLLMTEHMPITEICYQSGFKDVKTFNKLFRKECGKNPTEFRKEFLNE